MRIPVQVKVSPVVREFMVCFYGSHIIQPHYEDAFGWLIKLLLEIPPKDYTYKKLPDEDCLTFLMPHGSFGENRNYNLYRHYLSPMHHRVLDRIFYKQFKETFHYFMVGALRGGAKTQKEAIYIFCDTYNLPLRHITFDLLKKSWDRSVEKKYFQKMT
jgi:hypothetical protein